MSEIHTAQEIRTLSFPDARPARVCVVLPAYRAAHTLEATLDRLPRGAWHHLILVDDASDDGTTATARRLRAQGLPLVISRHERNRGYGGNQKTCYRLALQTDADVFVMLHPDGQYDPALVPNLVGFIEAGVVDIVLGSRILKRAEVLAGGMPPLKYAANRLLTIVENIVLGFNLPEYHTGFRAYHRRVFELVDFEACSDGFPFDQQVLVQARVRNLRVGAVPVPTHYGPESSSISLTDGARYTAATFAILSRYLLYRAGWRSQRIFRDPSTRKPPATTDDGA